MLKHFLLCACVCPYNYTDPLSINDLYHVNVHLIEMVHLWRKFGLALGLEPLTLERIRSNSSPKDAESSFTEMLATWLKGEDRLCDDCSPNWGEVIAALRSPSVERREYADNLVLKLRGG